MAKKRASTPPPPPVESPPPQSGIVQVASGNPQLQGSLLSGQVSIYDMPIGGFTSGMFVSGYGHVLLVSGTIGSGDIAPRTPAPRLCKVCGKQMSSWIPGDGVTIQNPGHFEGKYEHYCFECAGFVPGEGFVARERWIKESVPLFCSGMPAIILADYLEDQGRDRDAEWLRVYRSGK